MNGSEEREVRGIARRGLTAYGDPGFSRFIRRAFSKGLGFGDETIDRPLVGVANTYSELNSCHMAIPSLVEAVKRGVLMAGGLPVEFPTISLGEPFLHPTSMLLRNLMSIDTEEMLRAQPLDGAVLIGGCDKTIPAQLMGAISADIPALIVPTGPMAAGRFEGRDLGACTDCRRFWSEYRAGRRPPDEIDELENVLVPGAGTCGVMGTASTMASISEALGMTLLGGAATPATSAGRLRFAEWSGRAIVRMAVDGGPRPTDLVTPRSVDNAVRVAAAVGGSTNAVIHLIAIARRARVSLDVARFDELSRATPLIAAIKPTGPYHMADLYESGGIPRVMERLSRILDLTALTASGRTLGAELSAYPLGQWVDPNVIATADAPFAADSGFAALFGNLAPRGAILKHHVASPSLLRHRGPAVVFSSLADLDARIDAEGLSATADSVLVLQNAGPVGAPGMPEAGMLPIPRRLLAAGVSDMVRISDARMSGTAFGTVILHVAPEAAVGGPLALVRNGDMIELDVIARKLDLLVPEEELAARRAAWTPPPPTYARGYRRLFVDHVLQADEGCDFDFLVPDRT